MNSNIDDSIDITEFNNDDFINSLKEEEVSNQEYAKRRNDSAKKINKTIKKNQDGKNKSDALSGKINN